MQSMSGHDVELAALAAHMSRRRSAILQAWRASVTSDPALTTGASLPRAQLHDHIPAILVDYERRLGLDDTAKSVQCERVQRGDAAAHGLHRWQQGFDLAEVTRELGRLNECVVVELDSYCAAHPALEHGVMAAARRIWAQQHGAAIGASTSQYFHLQQVEAGSHIQDLEHAERRYGNWSSNAPNSGSKPHTICAGTSALSRVRPRVSPRLLPRT